MTVICISNGKVFSRIDYESSYEERIERLYQAKNQYHEELMFPKKRRYTFEKFIKLGLL